MPRDVSKYVPEDPNECDEEKEKPKDEEIGKENNKNVLEGVKVKKMTEVG